MKNLIFTLIALFAANAFATDLKLDNIGAWKLTELSGKGQPVGNAEAIMTLQVQDDDFIPVIMIEKRPLVAVLESIEEWHHLIFLNKVKEAKIIVMNERVVKIGESIRYFVQFQADTGSDSALNGILMATSVNGEIFTFTFQNLPKTFRAHSPAVRQVLRTMQIGLKTP